MSQPFETVIEEQLRLHGSYAACAVGNSMRPMLRDRSDVVVLVTPFREPCKYDVILYRGSDGRYILHRIIKLRKDEYLVRGDNTYFTERVAKSDVIALLASYNKNGKDRSLTSPSYKLYSRIWNCIYPVRKLCHGMKAFASRVFRKLFTRKKTERHNHDE